MVKICDSIGINIFKKNHILLAVGNELKCHEPKHIKILPWKIKGKIHGIDVDSERDIILVYGEREFLLLNFEENDFQLLFRGKISDWISSGKLLENDQICFVTGHLATIMLEYDRISRTCWITNKSYCPDKTTLYCSYIYGKNSWNDLIVFGGTAMDVIVFRPLNSNIIQRLSGKNGVTLSIDVNETFNMMITTSDDRSLKIYNIHLSKDRENTEKLKFSAATDCFIQSYAHTARVFQGKIIIKENLPYILTVGEDSNLCIWNQKGELLFRRLHHFGSPIWNLAFDITTDTVFTTSSDGNCRTYNLKSIFKNSLNKSTIESINDFKDLSNEVSKSIKLEKIGFLCSGHIIIGLTNENNLVVKIGNKGWTLVNKWFEHDVNSLLLKNKVSILKTYKNQIALGAFNSLLIIKYDTKLNLFQIEFNDIVSDNYIKSIFFLNEDEYLVCDENGNCKLFMKNFKEQILFSIQKSRDISVTSAFKLEKYILLSNRQGQLFLFVYENNQFVFKDCVKKVNGNFGVTNICLDKNFEKVAILKTYGHDKTTKIVKLNKECDKIHIISRVNVAIFWVEKVIHFLKEDYLAGFNSTNFILWNKTYGELFNYNCGGGHRFWDCCLNFEENNLKLIFIKKGKMHTVETEIHNVPNNLVKIKQHKWHIKECNILRIIEANNIHFVVSGGEDNILKISKLVNKTENEFCVIEEMNQHISCIKALRIFKTLEYILIFSAGGRAQICVTQFDLNTLCLEEKCNFMLKSTDFERNFNGKTQKIDFDPETRLMSIDVLCNSNEEIDILAGCSDGYIRKFLYRNNKIEFIDALLYNKCILHVKIINECMLMTASTDGTIKIWNLLNFSSNSIFLYELKHHESGINSIDILEKNNCLYIITGGDDQNIVYSIIQHNTNFEFNLIENKQFNFLHTAQVTGVKITKDINYFYSTSIDQTVCKYSLKDDKLIEKFSMCVADIKGLELLNPNNDKTVGAVYGCGLESF